MFLLVGGELLGCGGNDDGELGLGHNNSVSLFTKMKFKFPSPIYQFAKGSGHNLVLLENRDIYVWGYNYYEQLGLGDRNNRLLPTQLNFPFPSFVIQLFSKSCHNFALLENGDVYGWGRNIFGQLGLRDMKDRSQPTKLNFSFPSPVRSIHCGLNFSLFLLENGFIYGCGKTDDEELGIKDEKAKLEPTRLKFEFPSPIRNIECGYHCSLFLLESDEIYTWGNTSARPSFIHEVSIPTKIDFSFPSKIRNIYCEAYNFSYILLENNQLFGLDNNYQEEFGVGDTNKKNISTLILISFPIEEVYCDFTTSFVISSSNNQTQLYGWGNNQSGDLGLGDKEYKLLPTLIPLSASDIKFPPSSKNQWNPFTHRFQSSKNRERIETLIQLHHESVPFLILEEIIQFL